MSLWGVIDGEQLTIAIVAYPTYGRKLERDAWASDERKRRRFHSPIDLPNDVFSF